MYSYLCVTFCFIVYPSVWNYIAVCWIKKKLSFLQCYNLWSWQHILATQYILSLIPRLYPAFCCFHAVWKSEAPSCCIKRDMHATINFKTNIDCFHNELSECSCLHSIWRLSTHHTWSELESVDVLTKYIMLFVSFRLRRTFSHCEYIFFTMDMITRHRLMFVFPNMYN